MKRTFQPNRRRRRRTHGFLVRMRDQERPYRAQASPRQGPQARHRILTSRPPAERRAGAAPRRFPCPCGLVRASGCVRGGSSGGPATGRPRRHAVPHHACPPEHARLRPAWHHRLTPRRRGGLAQSRQAFASGDVPSRGARYGDGPSRADARSGRDSAAGFSRRAGRRGRGGFHGRTFSSSSSSKVCMSWTAEIRRRHRAGVPVRARVRSWAARAASSRRARTTRFRRSRARSRARIPLPFGGWRTVIRSLDQESILFHPVTNDRPVVATWKKRAFLAIFLSFAVLAIYQAYFAPKPPCRART